MSVLCYSSSGEVPDGEEEEQAALQAEVEALKAEKAELASKVEVRA